MTTQNLCVQSPVVSIVNNTVTALSIDVARYFERPHDYVLKAIRTIIKNAKEAGLSLVKNYESIKYKDLQGIERPAFRMDRKGFVLLAMGFTGINALRFKNDYIDKFDSMERQLYKCPAIDKLTTLTPQQAREIQIAVAEKATTYPANYKAIYSALKRRFQVARYDQIPSSCFREALDFIETVELNVPQPYTPQNYLPPIPAIPVAHYKITDEELRAIKSAVYYFDEFFKPQIQWAATEARRQNRPDASRFYDVWHEPTWLISRLRRIIERNS